MLPSWFLAKKKITEIFDITAVSQKFKHFQTGLDRDSVQEYDVITSCMFPT